MNDSSFWRAEIWHPLSVHFPIAFLILATLTQSVALVLRTDSRSFWQNASSCLLYLGSLAAWLSIYTGNMADGIVSREICDPTVLKDHEIAAYNVAYLFSASAVTDLCLRFSLFGTGTATLRLVAYIVMVRTILRVLVFLLMVAGSAFLIQAGHLGASAVYQQAGGVQVPASDCSDYNGSDYK